jgi:hypothetical protein
MRRLNAVEINLAAPLETLLKIAEALGLKDVRVYAGETTSQGSRGRLEFVLPECDSAGGKHRRMTADKRRALHFLLAILREAKHRLTLPQILDAAADQGQQLNERTTERHLRLLLRLGKIDHQKRGNPCGYAIAPAK